MLDHKFYINDGVRTVNQGLGFLKTSHAESGNILLGAIIRNIEDQLSMIDGRNEVHPGMKKTA